MTVIPVGHARAALGAVAQVQVVFTLLLSFFYFGERIRPAEIAGIVIIVAGLILFRTA